MSTKVETGRDFDWEQVVADSRGLPQLGVAPDILIHAQAKKGKGIKTESTEKETGRSDTLRWGFYSALNMFVKEKLK